MTARPSRRLAAVLVIGAVGLGLAGCSGSNNSDAARVTYHDSGGDHTIHITRSDFTNELEGLSTNKPFADQLDKSGFTGLGNDMSTDQRLSAIWLTQLIRQAAAEAEFHSENLQLTSQDASDAATYEKSDFGSLLSTLPRGFLKTILPRYERMAAVYRHFATCPSGKFVSHILLKTERQAADTRRVIVSGRASFAALAKAQSTDTQSGANGGGLGCLSPSEFVEPFQSAAETAPIGVVTQPVKTQFGYHLILVRPWDAQLDQQYAQSLSQAASAVLSQRLKEVKVWVNPLYGSWGQVTDSQGNPSLAVIPPAVPAPRVCREASAACTPTSTTSVPAGSGGG
jgi:hypothetical protein